VPVGAKFVNFISANAGTQIHFIYPSILSFNRGCLKSINISRKVRKTKQMENRKALYINGIFFALALAMFVL
jgi:hypothetical protein